jgi:hypothetical protein
MIAEGVPASDGNETNSEPPHSVCTCIQRWTAVRIEERCSCMKRGVPHLRCPGSMGPLVGLPDAEAAINAAFQHILAVRGPGQQ